MELLPSLNILKNLEIIGIWIHKVYFTDSPGELRRLEFFEDGDIIYCRNAETTNLLYQMGKFKIINDTRIIKLFNYTFKERFIYYVEDSSLYLERINENPQIDFPIKDSGKYVGEK
jgi:hypothetical protein